MSQRLTKAETNERGEKGIFVPGILELRDVSPDRGKRVFRVSDFISEKIPLFSNFNSDQIDLLYKAGLTRNFRRVVPSYHSIVQEMLFTL